MRVKNQLMIVERYAIESNLNIVLKLQSELVAAKELAEHSSRVKSEFLSRMSHEMLTPMNVIIGMINLTRKHPEKSEKFLNELDESAHSLIRMINNVLDISDMEYGVFKLDETGFSLREMLSTAVEETTRYLEAKQQKVTCDVEQTIPDILIGDEKRLYQVITCLLSNAIKFTQESGEIHIHSSIIDDDGRTCTIQTVVKDNGSGISKEQQERLFEIFEQEDGSRTRKHGGIGIGLALSKRIVEMMDGDIWVESESGKGAKFTFTYKLQRKDMD